LVGDSVRPGVDVVPIAVVAVATAECLEGGHWTLGPDRLSTLPRAISRSRSISTWVWFGRRSMTTPPDTWIWLFALGLDHRPHRDALGALLAGLTRTGPDWSPRAANTIRASALGLSPRHNGPPDFAHRQRLDATARTRRRCPSGTGFLHEWVRRPSAVSTGSTAGKHRCNDQHAALT
jgi:hypothetical protein